MKKVQIVHLLAEKNTLKLHQFDRFCCAQLKSDVFHIWRC